MESDIIRYYEQYDEEGRLTRRRWGQVEYLTTMKYLRKYLRPGDRVLVIGAGTGRYFALQAEKADIFFFSGCLNWRYAAIPHR